MVSVGLKAARTRSRVEISSEMPSRAKYSACMGTMRVSAADRTLRVSRSRAGGQSRTIRSKLALDGLEARGAGAGRGRLRLRELDVGAGEVLRAGQQPKPIDIGGENHLLREAVADEHIVDGMAVVVALEAEAGGGVGLRIAVDQEDLEAFQCQTRRQIDGRGGLSYPALLVDDADDLAHGIPE